MELAVGKAHACGRTAGGAVSCWGGDRNGETAVPEGIVFARISAGSGHTCGIAADASLVCWGSNTTEEGEEVGQADPP